MEKLHPGARWIFRFKGYEKFGFIIIFLWITFFMLASPGFPFKSTMLGFFLITTLIILLGIEIYARMSYNRYLYEITDNSIKIEWGIIKKRYSTVPYSRVQNVLIRRGILARIFGYSTVDIETAGMSGNQNDFSFLGSKQVGYKSEGHLPAISIEGAGKIKDFILEKIKSSNGSGM